MACDRDVAQEDSKFLVNASYLEIYNENVRDLLARDTTAHLELKEHPEKGVYVKDLSMNVVHSALEMHELMIRGTKMRAVGATAMNAGSSRSHSIFTVWIEACQKGSDGEEHIRAGKLNLVDLAVPGMQNGGAALTSGRARSGRARRRLRASG